MKSIILFFAFICPYFLVAQVLINEISSANEGTILDEFGEASDWIELYYTSTNTVNLTDYWLSDDEDYTQKWQFPNSTIAPNAFLLIFAADKNGFQELHTNFKLKKAGEIVNLSTPDGTAIDHVLLPPLSNDISYGRALLAVAFYRFRAE